MRVPFQKQRGINGSVKESSRVRLASDHRGRCTEFYFQGRFEIVIVYFLV